MEHQKILEKQRRNQEHIWGHLSSERWQSVQKYAMDRVLDVGCANGIYVKQLHEIGREALGIDLLYYEEWFHLLNYVLLGDAKSLPIANEAFDTIISFETLEHVPDPEIALREYHRVCRKNIIVSVPNCETPSILRSAGLTYHHWVDRSHTNFFTLESFQQLIQDCGFEITEARYINPILPGELFFYSLGFSNSLAKWVARAFRKISHRKYYMTLLVVGEKLV